MIPAACSTGASLWQFADFTPGRGQSYSPVYRFLGRHARFRARVVLSSSKYWETKQLVPGRVRTQSHVAPKGPRSVVEEREERAVGAPARDGCDAVSSSKK
jgi:hypothetical protein